MKKAWNWLVYSSADPKRYSATLKSSLLLLGTVVASVAGVANIQVGDLNPLIAGIVNVVESALYLISSIGVVYGLGRKLWLSAVGENKVLNQE